MEKISSILPSSARITSVDLKEGSALRPGVPTFGRTEGTSGRRRDRAASPVGETAQKAGEVQKAQLNWRDKDAAQAALAQQITHGFFGQTRKEADMADQASAKEELERGDTEREVSAYRPGANSSLVAREPRESRPTGFHTEDLAAPMKARNFHPDIDFEEDEARSSITEPAMFPKMRSGGEPTRQQPDGLYPKGSFIDRSA